MVRIRFIEIKGLYSYGSEKNRIDFGEKTLIVGPNNSGKSSIFKALDFFLRSLTEYTDRESKPWHEQDTHEMTVGFTLNDPERRYTAEVLLIRNPKGTQSFALAQRNVVEWLACRLKNITLTIRWIESPFSRMSYRPQYLLQLDELGITINAKEYNSDAWAARDSAVSFPLGTDAQSLGNVIEESILQDSLEIMRSTGQSNPLTPTKNTPKRRLASQSGIADGFGLSKKGSVLRKICIVPLYGWVFLTRIRSGYQVALEPVVHLAPQNHCYCHL